MYKTEQSKNFSDFLEKISSEELKLVIDETVTDTRTKVVFADIYAKSKFKDFFVKVSKIKISLSEPNGFWGRLNKWLNTKAW